MQESIHVTNDPAVQYLLRVGDTCLVLGQRIAEWCGHGPILEEDIALTNMALDLIGQARAVLTLAGQRAGQGHDEDHLAFLRDESGFRNITLAELPRGDFAVTVLRNTMVATFLKLLWARLQDSSDEELAAIAGKAIKEARYHQQHAADWLVRLGGGTDESRRRSAAALASLWRYAPEMFFADTVDAQAQAAGLGPSWASLEADWRQEMTDILNASQLVPPESTTFRSTGKQGVHSEHMGYLLAEMQSLQRSYPGGVW